MTCIIGLETKDGVILGADSLCSAGHETGALRAGANKFARIGNHLIVSAGPSRLQDVIRYHLTLPNYAGGSPHKHVVTKVVPALRRCLAEHLPERDKDLNWRAIVGVGGAAIELDGLFHAAHVDRGFVCAGTGGEVALGALYASAHLPPKRRVRLALEAACSLLSDCGPPFVMKEMKK